MKNSIKIRNEYKKDGFEYFDWETGWKIIKVAIFGKKSLGNVGEKITEGIISNSNSTEVK